MACTSAITGMMMTAGMGLLSGAGGLATNSALGSALASVNNLPIVSQINSIVSSVGAAVSEFGSGILGQLSSLGGATFASLANAMPLSFTNLINEINPIGSLTAGLGGLTDYVSSMASFQLPDINGFINNLGSVESFLGTANQFITAAGSDSLSMFTNMNSMITGGFSDISSALPSLATDFAGLGSLVNFAELSNLGNPLQLVNNVIEKTGGLDIIGQSLSAAGINTTSLTGLLNTESIGSLSNAMITNTLTGLPESLMGSVTGALGSITGSNLAQLQTAIGSEITGIASAVDLLDPSKIFPGSNISLASFNSGKFSDIGSKLFNIYT